MDTPTRTTGVDSPAGRPPTSAGRPAIRRAGRLLRDARPTGEHDSTTTFELLFDLVYVFALTQVTGYMGRAHSAQGVLQGILLLALLWWTWSAYTWLGNQARADEGLMRGAMALAMTAMFVVALAIPEAWQSRPGGLNGPLVLVCAYIVVRCVHLLAYGVAAAGDSGLRHQLAISWAPLIPSAALLLAGALVGGWGQTLLFAAALLVEWAVVYLTSRNGNWRIHSAAHWTERYGLFVILAIGESLVAIGVGAANHPLTGPLLLAAVLGVATAVCLWWLYFDVVSLAAEHRFVEAQGADRVKIAVEAYTYGHFPIVAGIVIAAVGIRGVLAHADQTSGLGAFYAAPLFAGAALYLLGHVLFKYRMHNGLSRPRLLAAGALLVVLPAAIYSPPLAALGGLVAILAALIAVETVRYGAVRSRLRES